MKPWCVACGESPVFDEKVEKSRKKRNNSLNFLHHLPVVCSVFLFGKLYFIIELFPFLGNHSFRVTAFIPLMKVMQGQTREQLWLRCSFLTLRPCGLPVSCQSSPAFERQPTTSPPILSSQNTRTHPHTKAHARGTTASFSACPCHAGLMGVSTERLETVCTLLHWVMAWGS